MYVKSPLFVMLLLLETCVELVCTSLRRSRWKATLEGLWVMKKKPAVIKRNEMQELFKYRLPHFLTIWP